MLCELNLLDSLYQRSWCSERVRRERAPQQCGMLCFPRRSSRISASVPLHSFSPRCWQSLSAAWRWANTSATLWVKCQDMAWTDSAWNLPGPLEITKPGALESQSSVPITFPPGCNLQRPSGEAGCVDRPEEGCALDIDFLRSGRRLPVFTHLLDTILTCVAALKGHFGGIWAL